MKLLREPYRLLPVVGFPDHHDRRVLCKDRTYALTDEAVIVCQQHPDLAHACDPFLGIFSDIVVPRSREDLISMTPPSSRARSSIPISPSPECGAVAGSKPTPSSLTARSIHPLPSISRILTCRAVACLAQLVSVSCTIR